MLDVFTKLRWKTLQALKTMVLRSESTTQRHRKADTGRVPNAAGQAA